MTAFEIFLQIIIVFLIGFGPAYYIVQTVRGTVVPHRLTYFFWFVAQAITLTASLVQGVTFISQTTVIVSTIACLLIFVSSFFQRDGIIWRLTKLDWVCAVLCVMGIILWQTTDIPNLAIMFAIIADFIITVPTLIKSYRAPETESILSYFIPIFAHVLNISFLVKHYDFQTLAMQAYLVFNLILIVVVILLGRYTKPRNVVV